METAIVTGSTKGIGLAIAKALLRRKYFVVMNYANDTENAERVTEELSHDHSGQFVMIGQRLETKEDVAKFHDEYVKTTTGGGGKITDTECGLH